MVRAAPPAHAAAAPLQPARRPPRCCARGWLLGAASWLPNGGDGVPNGARQTGLRRRPHLVDDNCLDLSAVQLHKLGVLCEARPLLPSLPLPSLRAARPELYKVV